MDKTVDPQDFRFFEHKTYYIDLENAHDLMDCCQQILQTKDFEVFKALEQSAKKYCGALERV